MGIDHRKGDDAWSIRPISPRVLRSALDQYVARAEQSFPFFHHGPDLTFNHEREVQRRSLVHMWVTRKFRGGIGWA
jgi:hypothetical protein